MLTPQDIENQGFRSRSFGGYDVEMVDKFLDEVHKDYSALYKENAVLKSKMKVLVDKIEEYRSVDEAMRSALLAAQNTANDMVAKAKKQSEELTITAKREAERRIEQYRESADEERMRSEKAKQEANKFFSDILAMYEGEIERIKTMRRSCFAQSASGGDVPKSEERYQDNNLYAGEEREPFEQGSDATIKISDSPETSKIKPEQPARTIQWHDETNENGMFTSTATLSGTSDMIEFLKNIGDKGVAAKSAVPDDMPEVNDARVYSIQLDNDKSSVSIQEPNKQVKRDETTSGILDRKFDHLRFGKNYDDTDE